MQVPPFSQGDESQSFVRAGGYLESELEFALNAMLNPL